METIIFILVALGSLSSPSNYSQDWADKHKCEVTCATSIYDHHQYVEVDGGVVIEDGVDPCDCK